MKFEIKVTELQVSGLQFDVSHASFPVQVVQCCRRKTP